MTCSCFYIMYFDCIDTPFPSLVPLPRIPDCFPTRLLLLSWFFVLVFVGAAGLTGLLTEAWLRACLQKRGPFPSDHTLKKTPPPKAFESKVTATDLATTVPEADSRSPLPCHFISCPFGCCARFKLHGDPNGWNSKTVLNQTHEALFLLKLKGKKEKKS